MAAAPNIAALALAPPVVASYRDFYNSATNDPFNGTYASVTTPYVIPLGVAAVPPPLTIANGVYNSVQHKTPTAFLIVGLDNRISLYHRLSRFDPRMGMPASQWDNRAFANSGDLFHNNPVLVEWDNRHFHQGPQTHAPLAQTIEDALAQANAANPVELMGPFNNGDAGTEVLRTRMCMYCPPQYVGIFLENPLTPVEAWQRVSGAVTANAANVDCSALLTWLRVALTRSTANGPSVLAAALPGAPVPDAVLLAHRRDFLLQDFPSLDQAQSAHGANAIAHNLHQLVAEQRLARAEDKRLVAAEKIKPVSDLIGTQVVALMRLCQVATEAHLPPLWQQLSSCTKSQQLNTLTSAINEVLDEEAPLLPFQITPLLKDKVMKMQFRMTNKDDLTSGLQPFVFGTGTPDEIQANQQQVSLYQTIFTDQSAPSISDAQYLMVPKSVSLPLELIQARDMCIRTKLFFRPLFGDTHVLIDDLSRFCDEFNMRLAQLGNMSLDLNDRLLLPARIIRWVQIRLNFWFRRQWSSPTALDSPNLQQLFDKIDLEEQWEPHLPPSYTQQLLRPGSGTRPPQDAPSRAQTDISSITGFPPTAPPAASDDSTANRQVQILNTVFNTVFEPYRALRIRHPPLLRRLTVRPPASPHNPAIEMCLSFHIKGMCNTGCSRADDHAAHTPEQDQSLVTWCDEHYKAE